EGARPMHLRERRDFSVFRLSYSLPFAIALDPLSEAPDYTHQLYETYCIDTTRMHRRTAASYQRPKVGLQLFPARENVPEGPFPIIPAQKDCYQVAEIEKGDQ